MKKSSKFIMFLALLAVVNLFAACRAPAASPEGGAVPVSVKPLRVAVIQCLTGADASVYSFQVQTLQLSADYFNMTNSIKSLGGVPVELVWIDNMSDINAMKTVVESAFQDNSYDFCILAGSSAYTMPAIASTTKAGIPSLTKAQGDAIFAQGCKNIFCIPVTSSVQARLPVEFFQYLNKTQDIDPTKFGILCVDNEHGIATQKTYEELLDSMEGFDYVYSQRYPADITDMSSVITAMKMSGVEILLTSNAVDSDSTLLFNTMNAMNFNPITVSSGSGVLTPSFYQNAGDVILNVMCASISNAFTTNGENSEDFKKLRQLCFERYGHFGGDFLAAYYTMIEVIAQTVENTASRDWVTNADAMHKIKYTTTYQKVDSNGEYTDVQYFAENGTSPNSTALIVQFQEIDYEGKTLIEPVCVYPEANSIYDLVWDH